MCQVKMKKCKAAGCENMFTPSFSSLQKYCSSQCTYREHKKKQQTVQKPKKKYVIPKTSKKMGSILKRYNPLRMAYLLKPENKNCKIGGENCQGIANTIEHRKGRGDWYVDSWAEENDIPLTLDERFWMPACICCNGELENNSSLSQEHQLSKIHDGKKQSKKSIR